MGGPVTVTVCVPSHTPTTAGQTIYETLPDLCSLVSPSDAPATVRALRDAGYRVDVKQITFTNPGARARDVEDAPAGTLVIGVLNAKGTSLDIPPETKHLIVEVGQLAEGLDDELTSRAGVREPAARCAAERRILMGQRGSPPGRGGGPTRGTSLGVRAAMTMRRRRGLGHRKGHRAILRMLPAVDSRR